MWLNFYFEYWYICISVSLSLKPHSVVWLHGWCMTMRNSNMVQIKSEVRNKKKRSEQTSPWAVQRMCWCLLNYLFIQSSSVTAFSCSGSRWIRILSQQPLNEKWEFALNGMLIHDSQFKSHLLAFIINKKTCKMLDICFLKGSEDSL